MPPVPFYATVTPMGQLTKLSTSEKVLVTAVATDTLTIVRAQGSTTAKSIAAGWILANAVYAEDILNTTLITDELLTGTVNGSNTVFTTANNFSSIQVYKNGVAMHKTDDFTITGVNQITFVTAPATGTKLTASYLFGNQAMISGSNSLAYDQTPTGTVNGSNAVFTTAKPYIAGTLEVFINGIKQKRVTHFAETTPTTGVFTMGDAPATGDDIMVNYQFVVSVSGNADTLDGYHASATPTANTIPVLDSNAMIPAEALGGAWTSYVPTITNLTVGNGVLAAKYTRIGKTIKARGSFTFGTTSSISGAITITLPVASVSDYNTAVEFIGIGTALDTGARVGPLFVKWISTTTMALANPSTLSGTNPVYLEVGSARNLSNTVPFTFGTGDMFSWKIEYEEA